MWSAQSHTNTIEGFCSPFKRGVMGAYHKASAKYLQLYVAEFQFRYNNRKNEDILGRLFEGSDMRFCLLLSLILFTSLAGAQLRYPPGPTGQDEGGDTQQIDSVGQKPKEDKRGTAETPLIVKNYPQTSRESAKETEEDRAERADTDAWTVRIGIASIVVGLITALILVVQARVFWIQARRLKETVAEMKITTSATRDAAIAAQRSADVAEDTLIATNRPWLKVVGFKLEKLRQNEQGILEGGGIVYVKNIGNSPATNICPIIVLADKKCPIRPSDIRQRVEEERSSYQKHYVAQNQGQTLFPDEETALSQNVIVPIDGGSINLTLGEEVSFSDLAYVICGVAYVFTLGEPKAKISARLYIAIDGQLVSERIAEYAD